MGAPDRPMGAPDERTASIWRAYCLFCRSMAAGSSKPSVSLTGGAGGGAGVPAPAADCTCDCARALGAADEVPFGSPA